MNLSHFVVPGKSQANPSNIVSSGSLRFTVITPSLIRCQWQAEGSFEDASSQHFWHRDLGAVEFRGQVFHDGGVRIETEALVLECSSQGFFSRESLAVTLKATGFTWHYGQADTANLKGSVRTLDNCDGEMHYSECRPVAVSEGIVSRSGWAVVDDSTSLVFSEEGWLRPRQQRGVDFYFFGYGHRFSEALADYYKIAGAPPLVAKWVLGLWWSRWEKYRQSDLEGIVDEFETHGLPLSVCVVDMDWHMPGWTGYTWSPAFFPDPEGFFQRIHAKGAHACLNLHPSSGVAEHESAYAEIASFMGVDPASKETVKFDIANPKFIEAYFRFLHHPLEKQGVDFWWIDWQQEKTTQLAGLDPLWYLNHLHALDIARDGSRRPLILSRWGGAGSHRYPVGFSGDAVSSWASLDYQVRLTSQSANVGYGCWSHDIGGFQKGDPNNHDLFVRWVQFGCLSPVMRFHNCGDPTLDYKPWHKPEPYRSAALGALHLRRALMPYIYTAVRDNSCGGLPLCLPLYYRHPEIEDAYLCPDQYSFGPDLLAAPVVAPADASTGLSRRDVWFPEGEWFDFQTGRKIEQSGWSAVHCAPDQIPLFAVGGAAFPMESAGSEWLVFPGSHTSKFYDDDGESAAYQNGDYAEVSCTTEWQGERLFVTFSQLGGNRRWSQQARLRLRGFVAKQAILSIRGVGDTFPMQSEGGDWVSAPIALRDGEKIEVLFEGGVGLLTNYTEEDFLALVKTFRMSSHGPRQMAETGRRFSDDIRSIGQFIPEFSTEQIRCLVEVFARCGVSSRRLADGTEHVFWWNHGRQTDFSVRFTRGKDTVYFDEMHKGEESSGGAVFHRGEAVRGWRLQANYLDLTYLTLQQR